MPFFARTFQILIASPSDVEEEREIAVQTIQQWNDLNAKERQLVLLPLRWETHSAPEYGRRPQEVINRQIVDNCDLMIGIFWTRVGSPTGEADSGTIEEIERVANAGKPVMLYFSKVKQDPDKIDVEQLSKLKEFKIKTLPNALIETYANHIEFKEKLTKHLEIQLRELLAEQTEAEMGGTVIRPISDIIFHFADMEKGHDLGPKTEIETIFFEVENFDDIPDYSPTKSESSSNTPMMTPSGTVYTAISSVNKEYYRQIINNFLLRAYYKPIRFWLKNRGGLGARDIYIDLNFKSSPKTTTILPQSSLPFPPPDKFGGGLLRGWSSSAYAKWPEEKESSETWSTHLEIKALQPQREFSPNPNIIIGAQESCEVTIASRIYADTLPEPLFQELKLLLKVKKDKIDAKELLTEILRVEEQ